MDKKWQTRTLTIIPIALILGFLFGTGNYRDPSENTTAIVLGQIYASPLDSSSQNETEDHASYKKWKASGNAFYKKNKFTSALKKFQTAEKIAYIEKYPKLWAEINNLLGLTKWQLGIRAVSKNSIPMLNEAKANFQNSLKIYTYDNEAPKWGMVQNNLGNTLVMLGRRTIGHEAIEFFINAIKAYKNALLGY